MNAAFDQARFRAEPGERARPPSGPAAVVALETHPEKTSVHPRQVFAAPLREEDVDHSNVVRYRNIWLQPL